MCVVASNKYNIYTQTHTHTCHHHYCHQTTTDKFNCNFIDVLNGLYKINQKFGHLIYYKITEIFCQHTHTYTRTHTHVVQKFEKIKI